jgi:NADP-dependent 3-hydroxy acid dehydrogenase YdfG
MLARTLESNGAKVYITGRRLEKLQEAAKLAVSPTTIVPFE